MLRRIVAPPPARSPIALNTTQWNIAIRMFLLQISEWHRRSQFRYRQNGIPDIVPEARPQPLRPISQRIMPRPISLPTGLKS